MARTRRKTPQAQPDLLTTAVAHITELWRKTEKKFLADGDVVTLNLSVTLDRSQAAPSVYTSLSFKQSDQESGMDVRKTFKVKTSQELEDPNQTTMQIEGK
jgi:hypothetical protein